MERIAKSGLVALSPLFEAFIRMPLWPMQRPARARSRRDIVRGLWKSFIDPLGAAVLLVALAPLFLIVMGLVMLQSGRPIFYGHTRWGQDGATFKCWKFRTMSVDADARLDALLQSDPKALAEWNATAKLKDDPRVTAIGRILRRTSLDELPQLWNVLVGEMSLVGAGPIALGEEKHWGDQFRYYLAERPGITGPWQVRFRNSGSYRDRLVLQRHYLAHWTPWTDIVCLLKTLSVPFERKNAY